MIAVELQSVNGDKLQVAAGKSVEVELAIANNQVNDAPQSIPIWSFDEDKGYWIEEGVATRQGNYYIASLTHFSWWNWDVPLTLTSWSGTVLYHNGNAAQNVSVCFTVKSINTQRCAPTSASGIISAMIPDEPMEISVVNECGENMLSFHVSSIHELMGWNPIKLNESSEIVVSAIQGIALQCDGLPVTSGFAKVYTGSNVFIFPIKGTDGHYEGSFEHCKGDLISVQFIDATNNLESSIFNYSADRNMNIGTLAACDQVGEFIRYKIKGFATSYNYYLLDVTSQWTTHISSRDSIGVKGHFGFSFDGVTTGNYKAYLTFGNQVNLPNGQTGYFNKMDLVVIEYGGLNEFIRGTFTGKLNVGGNGAGGQGDSDVTGSFAVRNR